MSAPGSVRRDVDGAIGWITLDNPARHNAMSLAMWEGLAQAVAALDADPLVRVVVLRGAGDKAFVSGADISEFEQARHSPEANEHYERTGERAMSALSALGKPTLAMLNGWCIGGGVAIALCCDLRLAGDNLRYGIPAARLGIGYGWRGIRKLVDVVGAANAREVFFTARRFGADHALRTGFVHQVHPAATLEAAVRDECAVLAANAPLTMRSVKLILGELARADGGIDAARCEASTRAVLASDDFVEGRRAFMAKRPPRFSGR